MNRRLDLRPDVADDIDAAAAWYNEKDPKLAARFVDEVEAAIRRVGESPLAYPLLRGDVHRAVVHHFPYSIFYRVLPDTTAVIACLDQRMHPQHWWGRR